MFSRKLSGKSRLRGEISKGFINGIDVSDKVKIFNSLKVLSVRTKSGREVDKMKATYSSTKTVYLKLQKA